MDYDENDFQSQAFQLAAEENVKFPPGLRSYSLPKFDLDDNLHVNLRFNSLVESEALLGIQGQEDNQWIENFSGGSSGIEFSTSAAESCSISRRTNVWSEATSSESVEMLLKSVGQDEMIMEKTIVEESEAGDGSDNLVKQVDFNSKQDGCAPKVEDPVDGDSTLQTDKSLQQLSELSNDAADKQLPLVEDSVTNECEKSMYGSSKDLGPSSLSGKCTLAVVEENLSVEGKGREANQMEEIPFDDSGVIRRHAPLQTEGLQVKDADSAGENLTLSKEADLDDKNCRAGEAEIGGSSVQAQSTLEPKHDSTTAQGPEISNEGFIVDGSTHTSKWKDVVSFDDTDKRDLFTGSIQEAPYIIEESASHSAGISPSAGATVSNPVMSTDMLEKIRVNYSKIDTSEITQASSNIESHERQEFLLQGGDKLASEVCLSNTDSISMEEVKLLTDPKNVSSTEYSSSSAKDSINASQATESIKYSDDGVRVQMADFVTKTQLSSCMHVDSMQTSDVMSSRIEPNDVHISHSDISPEKGHSRSPTDPGNVESESDGSFMASEKVCPSSTAHGVVMVHENPAVQVLADESVSGSDLSDALLACDNNSVGAHESPLGSIIEADKATELEEAEKSSSTVKEFGHIGKEEETATKVSSPPTLSCTEVGSQMEVGPSSVLELEQGVVLGNAGEEATLSNKDTPECSRELEGNPIFQESLAKGNDVAVSSLDQGESSKTEASDREGVRHSLMPSLEGSSHVVRSDSPDDTEATGKTNCQSDVGVSSTEGDALSGCKIATEPVTKDHPKFHSAEVGISCPNSNETNCGSPTVISCTESFQSEKENEYVGKSPLDQKVLISETNKVTSDVHGLKEKNTSDGDKSFSFEVVSLPVSSKRADSDWRPFPSIKPCEAPQLLQGSPRLTHSPHQIDPKASPNISHGTPRKSGGRNARKNKGFIADGTPSASAKTASREPSYEGILRKDIPRDDKNFTFEVSPQVHLPEKETGNGWKPFTGLQLPEYPQAVGTPPSASTICQIDPKSSPEISRGNTRTPSAKGDRRRSKADDKTRLASGKVIGQVAKEGNVEEMTFSKQMKERGSNSFSTFPSPFGVVSRVVQAEDVRPFGLTEGSSSKPCCLPIVQSSNLPDLNTSASTSVLFHQPFTDVQQVQLRAQIFVYGSSIQGTAPEEAWMVSAFGESDGGRKVWESVWRATVERLQHQKSPISNSETPLHYNSGAKAPEQTTTRQSNHQTEAFSTPGRVGSRGVPGMINSVIPMSSPIWTISTPREGLYSSSMMRGPVIDSHQTLVPLHPFQSPHLRHYIGNTPPWQSQTPGPATWIVAPQSAGVDANAKSSPLPVTESVHVTSVRESSVSCPTVSQPVPPSSLVHTGGPTSVSLGVTLPVDRKKTTLAPGNHASAEPKPRKRKGSQAFVELGQISSLVQESSVSHTSGAQTISPTHVVHTCGPMSVSAGVPFSLDVKKSTLPPMQSSAEGKPTKRKKNQASVESGQISSFLQPQSESAFATGSNYQPTSIAITTPSSPVPEVASSSLVLTSPVLPTHDKVKVGSETEQRAIFSKDTCTKIEEAKQHAEDAASLAASAVKHSQDIWRQLAIQKNAGDISDVEAQLSSAAVAIAAAAAVAKAAAAAAKVACDAAIQAKLMADEALASSKPGNSTAESVMNLGMVSPASILKGKDRTNASESVLVAAREATKKRVEAASAATKRAENLDAVVKAAGMAAEAVSQAGTIIAMGDPIPLTLHELVDAGSEGYWKAQNVSSEQFGKSNPANMEQSGIDHDENGVDRSANHANDQRLNDAKLAAYVPPEEMSRQPVDCNMWVTNMRWDSVASSEKEPGLPKLSETSDFNRTNVVVSESEIGSIDAADKVQNDEHGAHQSKITSTVSNIMEGSTVEVMSSEERRVWLPAKVLSLKDGKAFVCYGEVVRDEGSGQFKEWVSLEGEEGKAPRIRIPHPLSALKNEGTRKRRRSARGDYAWSVGNKVDAWIKDGWWEGTIIAKSTEDVSNLTVQFSAQRDVSVVRSWNLRPSLIWKDGQWIEMSSSRENNLSRQEGDSPLEKRAKLGGWATEADMENEARGKEKIAKLTRIEEYEEPESSRPLALSAKDKVFTIGQNIREDNKSVAAKRTGLQEGSRVVFGVPKPGKKKKFMDVSKHYVAANKGAKVSEGNDPVKFAKYLIPQESASRGWKNPSKVVNKGKRMVDSNPRLLKSGAGTTAPASATHDGTLLERQNLQEPGSFPNTSKASAGQVLPSSGLGLDAPSKKKPFSGIASNLQNRGKVAPPAQKLSRNEQKVGGHIDNSSKSIPEAVEPRRSNRRIQPTSRLLEGLQSSLIISKIPSASHDRSSKGQQRSAASSRGNNHG